MLFLVTRDMDLTSPLERSKIQISLPFLTSRVLWSLILVCPSSRSLRGVKFFSLLRITKVPSFWVIPEQSELDGLEESQTSGEKVDSHFIQG